MTWQEELSLMITQGWKPDILAGEFLVRLSENNMTVTLFPPQGIYAWWRGKINSLGGDNSMPLIRGRTASDVIAEIHRLAGLNN